MNMLLQRIRLLLTALLTKLDFLKPVKGKLLVITGESGLAEEQLA